MLAIGWVAFGWFVRQDDPQTTQSETIDEHPRGEIAISVQALINSAPFGLREKAPKQAVKAPSPSRRDIKLTGTVLAGQDSVAIIAPGRGKKPEVFHPGDTISPGVMLKTVEKQRILIEVGNRLEAVSLEKSKDDATRSMPVTDTQELELTDTQELE